MDAIESLIFFIYNLEVVIVLSFYVIQINFLKIFFGRTQTQPEPNPKIEGWVGNFFGLGWVTNPTYPNFWVGSKKSSNPTQPGPCTPLTRFLVETK